MFVYQPPIQFHPVFESLASQNNRFLILFPRRKLNSMASVREKTDNEALEWSPEDEIQLFFAMDGLRPVGINRHFFIACVVERLSKALNREVSSESVWSHLKTMYNLQALDEQDPLPFPNEESDFSLPETEYVLERKRKSIEEQPAEDGKKVEAKPEAAVKVAGSKEITMYTTVQFLTDAKFQQKIKNLWTKRRTNQRKRRRKLNLPNLPR